MGHTFTNINLHLIFSTKNREPMITQELRPRLHAYLTGIVNNLGGVALATSGPADHVHLLTSIPVTRAISELVRDIKANSSKWVNEEQSQGFAWQSGYSAFSVSRSAIEKVQAYIDGQEEHHRTVSFKEEYVAFLKRHEIAYDERYIWD